MIPQRGGGGTGEEVTRQPAARQKEKTAKHLLGSNQQEGMLRTTF